MSNFKTILRSKTTLVALIIVPAVLAGLGLVVFQTISMVTGKSFDEIDLGIGKLWESNEVVSINKDIAKANLAIRVEQVFQQRPEVRSFSKNDFNKVERPRILPKIAALNSPRRADEVIRKKIEDLFLDISKIDEVQLNNIAQKKQLVKYFNRLESEYLINPELTPKEGKWYIGFSFCPTLNYRTFSYDPSFVTGVAVEGKVRYTYGLTEKARNVSDKSVTSYSMGLDVGRRIGKRLSVFSGFYYSQYGEQILVNKVDLGDLNYEKAVFLGEKPDYTAYLEGGESNIPYSNKYVYLEIPIGLSIGVIRKPKSKITVEVGLSLQKLDHVNALVYDFDTDYYYWVNSKEEIFREFGAGTIAGVSLSQYLGERLEIFLNPHFKFNLQSTFKKPYAVNQNQYSTGLRIGLKQHLF